MDGAVCCNTLCQSAFTPFVTTTRRRSLSAPSFCRSVRCSVGKRIRRLTLLAFSCLLIAGIVRYSISSPQIDRRLLGKWSEQPEDPSAIQFVFYADGECILPSPTGGRYLVWTARNTTNGDEL